MVQIWQTKATDINVGIEIRIIKPVTSPNHSSPSHAQVRLTVCLARGTRVMKILQRSRYRGIVNYYFTYHFGGKLKIYLVSLLRYGLSVVVVCTKHSDIKSQFLKYLQPNLDIVLLFQQICDILNIFSFSGFPYSS